MVRQDTTKTKQLWNTTIVKKDLFNEILGIKEYEVIETLLGCTTQNTHQGFTTKKNEKRNILWST
jgi:hypothetical protein